MRDQYQSQKLVTVPHKTLEPPDHIGQFSLAWAKLHGYKGIPSPRTSVTQSLNTYLTNPKSLLKGSSTTFIH